MSNRVIKYESFKRGDTPVFGFTFTEPYPGFDWSTVTVDGVITGVDAPSNNSGATVLRQNQTLTVDENNLAEFTMQPTVEESQSFVAGMTYYVEVQLKDNGGVNVVTPLTGEFKIKQDYII